MAIIRTVKQENPFVQIDKLFLSDNKVSFKAKGILAYILSKPDGWTIRVNDLVKRSADGKAAIGSGIDELMLHGYIFKYQDRKEDGTFGEWVYEVYERPEYNPKRAAGEKIITLKLEKKKKDTENQKPVIGDSPKPDFPISEKPISEKPKSDNQLYSNNDFSNNDFSNNDYSNNHHQEGITERQTALINEVAKEHNLTDDDDIYIKLVQKVKEYKPNSKAYVQKIYETIINENNKPKTFAANNKEINNNAPDWFINGEHKKKKPQEKTVQPTKEEQKRLDELMKLYASENS